MEHLSEAALKSRLEQSEDPWVERKPNHKDERDIRKTLVGFANSIPESEAAVLFVGASNSGNHPGILDADDAQKKIAGLAREHCYPAIDHSCRVLTVNVTGAEKEILAVVVPFSTKRPHFGGVAHVRQGSQTVIASDEQFKELIASQNDKARKVLQFKGKRVWLWLRSISGFWFELDGILQFCDAHTVRMSDQEGWHHSFPIAEVQIHHDATRPLIITAKPHWTEEEQIRRIVRRWLLAEGARHVNTHVLNTDNYLVRQLLGNPALSMSAVSAECDGTVSPALQLLLAHVKFEIKKVQNPMNRDQKFAHLQAAHKRGAAKAQQSGVPVTPNSFSMYIIYNAQVEAIVEVATSISEVKELFGAATRGNPAEILQKQWLDLWQKLGLPSIT
jgi:hypothetical protein